jgi:hypothetical protein
MTGFANLHPAPPRRGLQRGLEENESWWHAVLDGSYHAAADVPAPG